MTNEEIIAYQKAERELADTEFGKAFFKFKSAHARAWTLDTEDSCTDRDRKSTKDAWVACNESEKELKALLRKASGI